VSNGQYEVVLQTNKVTEDKEAQETANEDSHAILCKIIVDLKKDPEGSAVGDDSVPTFKENNLKLSIDCGSFFAIALPQIEGTPSRPFIWRLDILKIALFADDVDIGNTKLIRKLRYILENILMSVLQQLQRLF
jgi:hypothetical protein